MADFKELNSLLGEYAVPEKTETGDSGSDLHSLLGEYGDENTKTLSSPKSRKSLATDIVQDVGIGTLELPGAVTGLADIPAGLMGFDRPFSKGAEKLGEATGFQPAKWAEEAEKTAYSPERVAAEQRVSKAWEDYDTDKTGIFSAIGKTLAEPRVLAGTVLKSAPSMAAGMGLARGAKALAPAISPVVAGAGGEGAIMAGQQMEQIDESVDPQRAALASTLTGVGGGALGYVGGKVAGKLGLSDLETVAAGGEAGAKALPIYKRVPAGAIQEGLLEEAPQSALEQVSQNIAEGKDVTEGMARAVTQGALAGGVMGAGTNILPSGETVDTPPATDEQAATQEPDFAEVPDTQPQEPIITGAPSDMDLRTDEERAAEQASELDLGITAEEVTPVVDTKGTEDFLTSYERAWADKGGLPDRVTVRLANEAYKLGIEARQGDSAAEVIAAMRAEIQARKTPEEVAQDVGDAIVAETLAAYPDGKPGIAGKTVIAGASAKVLEPQKIAAEQKLLEQQQPIVEEQVTELSDFEPEIPWEEYDDSIPGFEEPAPVVPLTPEELENMRIARDAAKYGIQEEEEVDEDADRQAALQARYEANKAQQEAQDALKQQETGEVYGGGSQQPGLRGEGERPAVSGEGVSPEGQAVGDIPSTEEKTVTQPTGEANGESEDQTAQTTTQEVTPESALREIGRLSDEAMGGNHPAMPQQSLANGDFAGSGKLNMDSDGNVVLTRVASSEDHLSKDWQDISGEELINTSLSHGGGRGIPTSGIASWGKSYGATHGGDRVIGTFKIPLQDLLSAIQSGNAILGNIGEGEIVLNPAFAEAYLASVTDTEGNLVTRKQDGISLPADITGRAEVTTQEVTEANEVWTNTEAQAEKANKLIAESEKRGVPIKTYSLFKMGSGTNEIILSTGNKAILIDANGNHDTFHMPTLQLNIAAGNAKEFTGKLDPALRKPVLPAESKPAAKQGGIAVGIYRSLAAPSTPVYKVDESGAIFRANTLGNWVKLSARAKDPLANLNSVRWELENNSLKFEREDIAPEVAEAAKPLSDQIAEAGTKQGVSKGSVLSIPDSGDLFSPDDPKIIAALNRVSAELPDVSTEEQYVDKNGTTTTRKTIVAKSKADMDAKLGGWTPVRNGFSVRAYNGGGATGPTIEIRAPNGVEVSKRLVNGEIDTSVSGTLDQIFSGEAISIFEDYFKDVKKLEPPSQKPLADQIAEAAYARNPKGEESTPGTVSHHDIAGLNINIETPAGTTRKSKDASYPPREMTSHYGNISKVKGRDGDQLDVFVNPKASDEQLTNPKSVYVIDQIDPATGKYDETKIMLGYDSEAQAREKYLENYDKGWQGLGAIKEMDFDEFKERIDSGKNWDEPVAYKEPADKVEVKKPESSEQKKAIAAIAKRFGIPAATVSDVVNSTSDELQNREDDPTYPAGLARIGKYGDLKERYVEFVKRFKPSELTTSEFEQGIKKHPSYAEYLALAKAGSKPPLISVSETYSGGMQSSNRRRTLVAQELNKPIDGWFSPINKETGDPLKYGDILRAMGEKIPATKVEEKLAPEEKPADQTSETGFEESVEAAEEQVPETELTVQPEPTKGKPVADDFLKLMVDFNRQQEKKYRLVESDVKPTIGKGGRLHAPHNGYEWIDGNIYAGGQWLPESEDSIRGSRPSKATIEATPEVAAYLEERAKDFDQIRVSLGKVYEKNGENRQYVYVEGGRALTRAITDLAPSRNKVLMAASDAEAKGLTLGKTWKYSYKRHFNKEVAGGYYDGSDKSLDKQIVGYYYPDAVIRDIAAAEEPVAESPKTEEKQEPATADTFIEKYKAYSSDKREEARQLVEDLIVTKKENGQPYQNLTDRLALMAAVDRGENVSDTDNWVYATPVSGHPENLDTELTRNLVPIKVSSVADAERKLFNAQDIYSAAVRDFSTAKRNLEIAKTAASKKAAKAAIDALSKRGIHEQSIESLRDETLPELDRLVKEAEKKFGKEPPIPFSRVEASEPLPELFESLGRVNKLSQLSDDQLKRIDEHPDAERIRYVQDNFLTLLSELDARPNSEFEIKC